MTGDTEPSLIDIMEPVDLSPNKEVEPLGYFPCYSGLNASQRGKYLMWLCDIDQPIDIGYVFLYYYGIERFLYKCPEKFNQAYAMILRLRKYHNVKSFPSYSFGALIGANAAPFVGAWIEITQQPAPQKVLPAAPFVGAWIEIDNILMFFPIFYCRTLRGCVD